jgi:glycosyltransferase involved in cell wall biosynthesis
MRARVLKILIISAQFPYPPRSGFAMRVLQLARRVADRHDVTLLSAARTADRPGIAALREELRVEVVEREPLAPLAKRLAQLASTASPRPYACRAVFSHEMQQAIDALFARDAFDLVQLESSLLCAYAFPPATRLVLNEHNIEYEVFRRMHERERSPARRAFNRLEGARFRRFEQGWWRRLDGCAVTSEREARILSAHSPATPVAVVPNGVDVEHFRPATADVALRSLVFNGLLDYRPNLDAAHHLVDEIWPLVLARCPDARLEIVGRGHPADIRRLSRPGVVVTGEVEDVRPHLARAAVVGVPIRMGGGTRLKVVEGLAMGKAMVSTSLGCEGIAVDDGEHLRIADGAQAFADRDIAAERLDGLYDRVTGREADLLVP